MKRSWCAFVLLVAVATTYPAATADAASPSKGTLSKNRKTLKWTGGPYNLSYPTTDQQCLQGAGDPMCDHYKLKIDMGQGARITVTIEGSKSGAEAAQGVTFAPNDFDLWVFDPAGRLVDDSITDYGYESVTFTHMAKWRNKYYEIRVAPYLVVPGATYKGSIKTIKYVK